MRHVILLLLSLSFTGCISNDATAFDLGGSSVTGRISSAVAACGECARKAGVAIDVSLSAVENAMAAQDDAEKALLQAMKTGKKASITSAEKVLKIAALEAEKARDMAKRVILAAEECKDAAVAAGEEAVTGAADGTGKALSASLKKVEHLLDIARQTLKKAEATALDLKKRWLLPVAGTTTTTSTTTTTTTQPPSPTPVGRR